MSDRIDRRISNRLLLGVGVLIIAVAVGAGAYLGWRMNTPAGSGTAAQPSPQTVPLPVQQLRRDTPLTVTLFYPVDGMLSQGSAVIKRQPDSQSQAREVLAALFTDRRAASAAVLRDLKLQELYFDTAGTVYIDLVQSQVKEMAASAGEELLALYAMVDTLMQNFDEIKQVCFLVDGREARTLAGHIDLSRRFARRMDLVRQ